MIGGGFGFDLLYRGSGWEGLGGVGGAFVLMHTEIILGFWPLSSSFGLSFRNSMSGLSWLS